MDATFKDQRMSDFETSSSISRIRKIGKMDGCHIERSKE